MRRYVFHSKLTPEQFRHRLIYRAEQYTDGRLLAEVSGDRVRLTDLGSIQICGQIPFVGQVSREGEGCVVTGGFPVSAVFSWRRQLVLWLLAVAVGSLFGVPAALMAVLAALWLALSVGLVLLLNRRMTGRRKRVLRFLEQEMSE